MHNKVKRFEGFVIEHKTLVGIFAVGLFFYIRNSDIPFWGDMPMAIVIVFSKNEIPGVSEMVKGVALSLVASAVFFYIVNYCPEYSRKEKAKKVVEQQIRTLYSELGSVVASY